MNCQFRIELLTLSGAAKVVDWSFLRATLVPESLSITILWFILAEGVEKVFHEQRIAFNVLTKCETKQFSKDQVSKNRLDKLEHKIKSVMFIEKSSRSQVISISYQGKKGLQNAEETKFSLYIFAFMNQNLANKKKSHLCTSVLLSLCNSDPPEQQVGD